MPRVGHVHQAVGAACEAVRPAQHGRRALGAAGEGTRGDPVQVEDLHLVRIATEAQGSKHSRSKHGRSEYSRSA